jgi:hypothetical protein
MAIQDGLAGVLALEAQVDRFLALVPELRACERDLEAGSGGHRMADHSWWQEPIQGFVWELDVARRGQDPNCLLSGAQKATLAERQWAADQAERARAPVWTVGDLKAVLADLPDAMEVELALDDTEGYAAWLREAFTRRIIADIRQPAGEGNVKTILVLGWDPPPPDDGATEEGC